MKATKWRVMKWVIAPISLVVLAALTIFYAFNTTPSARKIAQRLQERLTRDQEIELALSAAPIHLRAQATVYVLEEGKYVKVREGSNGFSCLVVRFGNMVAPYAYDQEGSETLMLADFRRAELVRQGKTLQEAQSILAGEFKSGKLSAPRRAGVAYMLSPEFVRYDTKTGEKTPVFPPHVMFYAPYVSNADIGARPEHVGSPDHVYILNEGGPAAMFIVVPKSNPAMKENQTSH